MPSIHVTLTLFGRYTTLGAFWPFDCASGFVRGGYSQEWYVPLASQRFIDTLI
jgi:hypothetical protein